MNINSGLLNSYFKNFKSQVSIIYYKVVYYRIRFYVIIVIYFII